MNFIKMNLNDFSENDMNTCLLLMDKSRREHIDTFKNQKRKRCAVCGEWLAKNLAAQFLGCDISEISLLRDEKGRPFIKDLPVNISISHSGDWVAAAVDSTAIGIDIEQILEKDLKLTKKVFTQKDTAFFEESDNKLFAFYKIWTAKEAYFKKIGTGITNLRAISYTDLSPVHYYEDELIITIVK